MPELSDDQWSQIEAALYSGRKIEAFKLTRKFTKVGMAEAKTMIDAMDAELRAQHPERFAKAKGDVRA